MRTTLLSILLLTAWPVIAQGSHEKSMLTKTENGVVLKDANYTTTIEVWSERLVRVHMTKVGENAIHQSFAVVASPEKVNWDLKSTADHDSLVTGKLSVQIYRSSGRITFADASGKRLLAEVGGGARTLGDDAGKFASRQIFELDGGETILGLGQHQSGMLNYRASTVRMQQTNGDVGVPVLVSTRGYGLFWDNPSVTNFAISDPEMPHRLAISSEAADAIDYYFIAGPELDDVIAEYRKLTGPAPMMPRWSWGFWQSKERYQSQQELLDTVRTYREKKIPIDGVVQDWQYWIPGQWGAHEFDPARFPDPAKMVDEIHQQHVHTIVSVWPRFDLETQHLKELEAAHAAYPPVYTNVYPPGKGKWYDAFSEEGRKIYWKQISEKLGRMNWDGWWLDASEAELGGDWGQMRNIDTAAGPGKSGYNAYPLMHTKGVYEGSRADSPRKRAFILTRSAWAGQQRNAAITWSGDIHGDWETFRRQIPAGVNFCASGIPYWNTDIGGFFGGDPKDADYCELFTRWYQFGAFCPMFRIHGTGPAKEIWRFDEKTQQTLIHFNHLRYRLLPYIYSTSWRVTSSGYTMMRPLAMDFRTDRHAINVNDQFMFGPSLLVNPVVQAKANTRNVYLPKCPGWYDFWSGKKFAGDQVISAAAGIDTMPIFVRAGSILPLGPAVQYADEKLDAPIELRVYRGADAHFDFYEDDGESYDYEQGKYAITPITWNDKTSELTVGDRQGDFTGMISKRTFKIVLVDDAHGGGSDEGQPDAVIEYDGKAKTFRQP